MVVAKLLGLPAGTRRILTQTPATITSAHHHQALLHSKLAGSKIKRRAMAFYGGWEDAQVWDPWKGHRLDFLSFLLKGLCSAVIRDSGFLSYWKIFLHSDPLSIGGWWVSPAQPRCSLWLTQSEDVRCSSWEGKQSQVPMLRKRQDAWLFKHHAATFWTQIYEQLSTFPWIEKGRVVPWVRVGDTVSSGGQRRVLSLS